MPKTPAACPQCGQAHVMPIAVEHAQGRKAVTYRCDDCKHEWTTRIQSVRPAGWDEKP